MFACRLPKIWLVFLALLVAQSVALMAAFSLAAAQGDVRFGGDFITFWLRACAVVEGQPQLVYDPGVFAAIPAQPRALLPGEFYTVFPYPPVFLLFLWPLGFIGLHAAMAAWLLTGFCVYLLAVRHSPQWRELAGLPLSQRRLLALFVAASPLMLANVFTAQTGFLVGALLIAGLSLADRRPWVVGVCFGLLCFKPHMALMAPVALIAGRNWRALAGAALTASGAGALSLLIEGTSLWEAYPAYLQQFGLMTERFTNMLTGLNAGLFHLLRIRFSMEIALATQACFFLLSAACVWKTWSQPGTQSRRGAVFMCATFLATPHMMVYDMTTLILPVLYLIGGIARAGATRLQKLSLALLLLAVPLWQSLANAAGLPLAFFAVLLMLASLLAHFERR